MRSVWLFSLVAASYAFQLPFKVPFFKAQLPLEDDEALGATPRIAIIGAGAAGSSAAFWISKAQERFGLEVEVDIYDKASYIGGRSTTVFPYDNTSYDPIELGASIFVKGNKNLWRASQFFNLTLRSLKDDDDKLGVWDGEEILLNFGGSWWDTLKVLWRYGITSPRRTNSIVSDMLKQFLTLYSSDAPKWDNITSIAQTLGWTDMIENNARDFFESRGVSRQYLSELVEAATRVNYGQNIDQIHGLEGAVSLAATDAAQVKGGNWQIFENFVKHSGAQVFLNTAVTRVSTKASSTRPWIVHSDKGSTGYKGVILAAPFHQTGIDIPAELASQIPEQPYIHLHVTLLSTTSPHVQHEYFSLPTNVDPPSMLLTTYEGVRQGRTAPEFNSVSYHGKISEDEWVVKIFSQERVSDEWLQKLFNGQVGWVYRKEWDAYPELPPTSTFPPVRLDTGFYYVNAFEPFISTMETETVASRNVVDLLLNEQFGSSICGPRLSGSEQQKSIRDDGYVFGWDC